MDENIQEVINNLESLQCDILLWKRREKSKKRRRMLADYDVYLDGIIERLYDYGYAED